MDRTRIIFVVIVVVALCIVGAMIGVQVVGNLIDGVTTSDSTAENDQPQVEVPAGGVLVTVASSNTKEDWMDQMMADFNAAGMKTSNGRPIAVEVSHVTSGGSMDAILDGSSQPTAWSPGDQSWVEQANETWQQRVNKPLASAACPATVYAPLGICHVETDGGDTRLA
ncbi:MAG: ABC transporter substrate-binding protein [Anaerolineae bacterium]|nr:ABC transporter substrate-binding protein [Anaerolineae bacterium]